MFWLIHKIVALAMLKLLLLVFVKLCLRLTCKDFFYGLLYSLFELSTLIFRHMLFFSHGLPYSLCSYFHRSLVHITSVYVWMFFSNLFHFSCGLVSFFWNCSLVSLFSCVVVTFLVQFVVALVGLICVHVTGRSLNTIFVYHVRQRGIC